MRRGLAATAAAWLVAARGAAVGPLTAEAPFLADRLAWREAYGPGDRIEAQRAGAYAVGSGRVFAELGLSDPLLTQGEIFGPTYQEPALGQVTPTVLRDGEPVRWTRQAIGWVPDAGIVATEAEGRGLAVRVWDAAPRGGRALIRIWEIVNEGREEARGLGIRLKLTDDWNSAHSAAFREGRLAIHQVTPKRETFWLLGFPGAAAAEGGKDAAIALPDLAPGERWRGAQLLTAGFTADEAEAAWRDAAADPVGAVLRAREEWAGWNATAVRLAVTATDPARQPRWAGLGDLLEAQKAIFRAQQAHSGSFSPLIGYSLAWVRDNNGPILLWLAAGKTAEVRAITEFFHDVFDRIGSVTSAVSVDQPTTPPPKVDESGLDVDHSEVPSWVVLQHVWLYLADGDLEAVRRRYPYLKRCLDGQVITENGLMLFETDETYLWTLQSRTMPALGPVNGGFGRYAWTPDSAFDWIAAARGLAELAVRLGRPDDAKDLRARADRLDRQTRERFLEPTEGFYCVSKSFAGELNPVPFANVLFNPLWVGSAGPDDPDARRSVLAGLHYLQGRDGLLKSSPWNGYTVGMNPGQWAVALARLRHPDVHRMLEGVLRTASPSGDFSELVDPAGLSWNVPAWGQGSSGRLRPWEGGLNADAVLRVLAGFAPGWETRAVRLAPYLPPELARFELRRLWTRDGPVDLAVERVGPARWSATVTSEATVPLQVTLDGWVPGGPLGSLVLDGERVADPAIRPSAIEAGGESGAVSFTLSPGGAATVVWGAGPEVEIPPAEPAAEPARTAGPSGGPRERPFGPLPGRRLERSDVLFCFSSTMRLKSTKLPPAEWTDDALRGLRQLRGRQVDVAPLEMDLPLTPGELRRALLSGGVRRKARSVVVFDRGAFSAGPQTNKPASFWDHPDVRAAFRDFVSGGGALVIAGRNEDRYQKEVQPSWLAALAGGRWSTVETEGTCLPGTQGVRSESRRVTCDAVRPGDEASEAAHGAKVAGPVWTGTTSLPLWSASSETIGRFSGRAFAKWFEFELTATVSGRYWISVWQSSTKPFPGLGLEDVTGPKPVRIGLAGRLRSARGRFFATGEFRLPAPLAPGTRRYRLTCPRDRKDATVYGVNLVRKEDHGTNALAEALGFPPDRSAGYCFAGLKPTGRWAVPLVLARPGAPAGLLAASAGDGLVIRTELDTADLAPLVRSLLDDKSRTAIRAALRRSAR